MRNLWQNRVLFNQVGANGDQGGGANSVVTPPNGGGTAAPPAGSTNNASGTAVGGTPPANPPAGNPPAGNQNQDWRSQLPTELQEDAGIKKFGSVPALAGAYVSLQKLIGKDKIPVPGDGTSDEQWQEIFEKLGVPKEAKDYAVKFKDGVQLEQKFTDEFKANAHKLGILPKQAQALADWFSDINLKSNGEFKAQSEAKAKQGFEAVQKEWGAAFQAKAARVNKFITDHGGSEAQKHFFDLGLGTDPVVLKVLSAAADKMYKEDKILGGDGASGTTYSPKEAMSEANKIIGDAKHPYHIKEHPGHKDAVAEVRRLFSIAHPNTQKV